VSGALSDVGTELSSSASRMINSREGPGRDEKPVVAGTMARATPEGRIPTHAARRSALGRER